MVLIPHGDTFRVRENRWKMSQQKAVEEKQRREVEVAFAMMDRYEHEHGLRLLKDEAIAKLKLLDQMESKPHDPEEKTPLNPICGFSYLDPIFRARPDPKADLRYGAGSMMAGASDTAGSDPTVSRRRSATPGAVGYAGPRCNSSTPGLSGSGTTRTAAGARDSPLPRGPTHYSRATTPAGAGSRPHSRNSWCQRPHTAPLRARSTRNERLRKECVSHRKAEVDAEQAERAKTFELQWRQNREQERERLNHLRSEREKELEKFHGQAQQRERASLLNSEPYAVRRASLGASTTAGTTTPGLPYTPGCSRPQTPYETVDTTPDRNRSPSPERAPTPGGFGGRRPRSAAQASSYGGGGGPLSTARSTTRKSSRPGSAPLGRALLPYQIYSDVAGVDNALELEADLERFEVDFTRVVVAMQSDQKTSLSKRFSRRGGG